MRSMRRLLPALFATLALTLSACGTTEDAAAETAAAGSGEKITVTDARGKEVTLDGPAKKVVTLEWAQTEDVIALGVDPVGIADIKGFQEWDTAVKVGGDPSDVGLRAEPSVEAVGALAPDLILGVEESIPDEALAQMEAIAPVVLVKAADATAPLDRVRQNFETTAKLLGKDQEAKKVLGDLDASLADGKAALADRETAPYVFSYIYGEGSQITFRMHADRSIPGAVAKQLGLTNAFTAPGDDAWGLQSYDVEALTTLPADTRFLYWSDDKTNPVDDVLPSNPVWTGLPFVKSGNLAEFGGGIWMYGGPKSMQQLVDAFVKEFAG